MPTPEQIAKARVALEGVLENYRRDPLHEDDEYPVHELKPFIETLLAATEPQEQHEAPAELVEAVRTCFHHGGGEASVTVASAALHIATTRYEHNPRTSGWLTSAADKCFDADQHDLQAAIEQALEEGQDENT